MKRLITLIAVGTIAAQLVIAAEQKPAVGLRVKKHKATTPSADYYAELEHSMKLDIELRNMRSTETEFVLQWLFLAKPVRGKGDRFVYDYDGDTIMLKGKEKRNIVATAKTIKSESWNYIGKFGYKPSDWVVVLFTTGDDPQILKVEASNAPLERKCAKFKGFQAVLDTDKELD